jgi:general secretion pathway protein G
MARAAARGQRGMTLLEIMIVLAILTLVMGILIGPRVFEMFSKSKIDLARTEMKQLAYESYIRWDTDNPSKSSSCPAAITDITQYANKKDGKDPWGNDYMMHCGDNAPPNTLFGLSSKGPDGKDGTTDDIRSWEL